MSEGDVREVQRADKIGLIVASVLVVVLLAGGGYLLYVRSQTLGAERPIDASVKLVSLDDTASAAATVAAAPRKAIMPKKPKGSDFGYVTNVSGSGKNLSLRWDQADLLTGSEADLYAKKNGAVVNTKMYFVANDTHKTKSFGFTPTAQIELTAADGTVSTLNTSEFARQWAAGGAIRKCVWWLFAKGANVYKLQQVVLPNPNL